MNNKNNIENDADSETESENEKCDVWGISGQHLHW